MKTTSPPPALLAAALLLQLAGCGTHPPADLPAPIRPAADERWLMTLSARGVQIYECRDGAGGPAWAFVAPEATLFDALHRPVGTHGAGPSWQAGDGSRVEGTVKARAEAPSPGAVPWLLLDAHDAGPAGRFSGVTSIQRLHTAGGMAPPEGCSAGSSGRLARVPYSADYVFYNRAAATASTRSHP